ncbi:hypothetical protein ACOMHN_011616 [Nucella lapillus]
MGGSSSKEKRTKPQTDSKKSKKVKIKGKSAKVKASGKKGSAQWCRADGEGGDVTFTPGRRKSSSDDVDDMRPPAMRARSKSLRFVDFTQLDRIRKVEDNELLPVDIAFFQEGKVRKGQGR